jgi:adenine-specific DNA-methyltransferase
LRRESLPLTAAFTKTAPSTALKTSTATAINFREPDQALGLFADIPFLNGGLFACLDPEDDTGKVQYADGFSRNPKQQAKVPNRLFFAEPHTVDLSGKDDFGDAKKKKATVRGLLHILNGYKFTIAESTPVEQEVALDPELLGNVFENLLASYNPETGESARKQTGSFYTPAPDR